MVSAAFPAGKAGTESVLPGVPAGRLTNKKNGFREAHFHVTCEVVFTKIKKHYPPLTRSEIRLRLRKKLGLVSVPKIISGHIDDAGRLMRVLPLCFPTVGRLDQAVHSCREPSVCAPDYSSLRKL
jgi:hypothetical protein